MGNSKESFTGTIDLIKNNAKENSIEITDDQIADRLNIPFDQFCSFYNSNLVPDEIFPLLRLHFADHLKGRTVYEFSFTVTHDAEDEDIDIPPPVEL